VISAFNFPVAVWSWNAALAAVCGDATVWKASEKTPLTAIAVTKIAERVCRETGADPAIFTLLMGDRKTVGQKLSADRRIPRSVISAFNFPVAVWSWNAALAAVCGDATVWKASEKTPLTAIAVTKIAERVCRETGADPAIFTLLMGDRKTVGQKLSADRRIP